MRDSKELGDVCPICNQVHSIAEIDEEDEVNTSAMIRRKEQFTRKDNDLKQVNTGDRAIVFGTSRIGPSEDMYIPISSHICETLHPTDPIKLLTISDTNHDTKIEVLKKQLIDVILLSKLFLESGAGTVGVVEFLKACEDVKAKIEKLFAPEEKPEIDDRMAARLEHLKLHIREVMEITKEFRNDTFLSPSVENFTRICEDVDEKINVCLRRVQPQPVTDVAKSRLYDLKSQLTDVVKLTEDYKNEGILTPSVENFLRSCEVVKSKIDLYAKETVDSEKEKLEGLKKRLKKLEEITSTVKEEGLTSPSIENFLTSCKDFKVKLDDYNKKAKNPPAEGPLHKLVSQLDETISLSKEAKKSGLVSESVEDFIKSCETAKCRIVTREKEINSKQQSKVLDKLEYNIDDVMRMVNDCQAQGLVTQSIEDFIKTLEVTKSKIDASKKVPGKDSEFKIIYPSCSDACTCGDQASPPSEVIQCKYQKPNTFSNEHSSNCQLCRDIDTETSNIISDFDDVCKETEEEWPEYVSPEQSEDLSGMCDVCRKYMEEEKQAEEEEKVEEKKPPPVDSSLGYFEKKVRRITKVKRTQNTDGTIREEREVITIRKVRRDPTKTDFADEDDNEYVDAMSHESVLEKKDGANGETSENNEDNEEIINDNVTDDSDELCSARNSDGCLRKTKSECRTVMLNIATPFLRKNISLPEFRC